MPRSVPPWCSCLLLAGACASEPDFGVYTSGKNAVMRGSERNPVQVWSPSLGTVSRVPTEGTRGSVLLGEAGPLWRTTRELPAVEKGGPVPAALVERAGFRFREVLGAQPTGEIDPVRGAGVSVRSLVKVRRKLAPPVYIGTATAGAHGIPGAEGRSPVTSPADCVSAIASLDHEAEAVIFTLPIPGAATSCAVPTLTAPVDLDGDGRLDVLAHGQSEGKGFRAWFSIGDDGTLTAGPTSLWTEIP